MQTLRGQRDQRDGQIELQLDIERPGYADNVTGARRQPEWAAVYGLLQSLLLAVSGGAIRLGTGHTEIAVDDWHEV